MKNYLVYILILVQSQIFSQDENNYFHLNYDNETIHVKNSEIENFINQKIIELENTGFPFAEIRLKNIKTNKEDLLVEKGNLYRLDSIVIYGNTKISQQILTRLIKIKKNDIYSQKKIDGISKIFEKSKHYRETKPFELVFYENTYDIYFYLEKISKNHIDALIGVNYDNKQFKTNGHLITTLQNNLNFEEEINIYWKSKQEEFQKFKSNIKIPSLFNYNTGISTLLDIYKKYSQYTNINSELDVQYPISYSSNISAMYQYKNSIAEQNNLQNWKTKSLGIGFELNRKNIILNIKNYFGNRKINDNNYSYINSNFNGEYKYKINNKSFFNLKNNTQLIISSELQENEKLLFGGISTIKGFLEDEFFSDKFSVFSVDYKYNLDHSTSGVLFAQQAYFNENNKLIQLKSLGIGTELKNKIGMIYMQYSIGVYKNKSFSLQNGIIHVGIKNSF